ncbi:uncharacterized protein LOC143032812 isoform X2 [Oratosquilla oratoria]|uniref:uncharacterized protein LOC143032812 isoform X2 n=1 Tax=Oratosquilla oratoria TaxID=337810 RepID=UPI003F766B62
MAQQGKMPSADISYVKKMPGMAVAVQLVTCLFAFVLSVGASTTYFVSSGHGFFIFITFLATVSCILWLLLRVLGLETLLPAKFDWNLAGLVYNGVLGFLVMVGSCVMVDRAMASQVLKAAGVFGFFGFTGFVTALVYEASIWYRRRSSAPGMASAVVVQGPDRDTHLDPTTTPP